MRRKNSPSALTRFRRAETGSNAVEFALVAPLLIAFLFGIYEFGLAIWTQGILDYAVEQAARCASVNSSTCGTASAIETYAATQTAPLGLSSGIFTATAPSCGNQVSASYTFAFVSAGSRSTERRLLPSLGHLDLELVLPALSGHTRANCWLLVDSANPLNT